MTTGQTQFQLSLDDITNLDKSIDQLYEQRPISEAEVKILCEKVSSTLEKATARMPINKHGAPSGKMSVFLSD